MHRKPTPGIDGRPPYATFMPTTFASQNVRSVHRKHSRSHVLFVSSLPPRECGIASYTRDLIDAIAHQFDGEFECDVCALENNSEHPYYPELPYARLNTDRIASYEAVAKKIQSDGRIQLVVIQHEFGFFSTQEEAFYRFLKNIQKRIVMVFHTVLPAPNDRLKEQVIQMSQHSSLIIVMTEHARNMLAKDYGISAHKVRVIHHGTHLNPPIDTETVKKNLGLDGRLVLSTFGLISSTKNIETTIDALPTIVERFPNVLFLIIGKTHPGIVQQEGEAYRQFLELRVAELHLEKNVRFVNEYLPIDELLEYLQVTDIYLFTSKDPHQAVSGTFAYALSSGCAVVSTPIPHALEVLNTNNGMIIDFENDRQLAQAVIALLEDEPLRHRISLISLQKMASTAWQNSAIAHVRLFNAVMHKKSAMHYRIPPFQMRHIDELTTDVGIVQFARLSTPDRATGYTLDDNARALIAACQYYETTKNRDDLDRIHTYLNFISCCWQPNQGFLNYLDANVSFSEQNRRENLDDSNGRAIWALGYISALRDKLPAAVVDLADEILDEAIPRIDQIFSTRAMAFIIKGLYYQNKPANRPVMQILANRLVQMYKHEKTDEWKWFENYMTYGNSCLPESLLFAYLSTKDVQYKHIAIESMDFLIDQLFENGQLKVISNQSWLSKERAGSKHKGGEQPIDVAYIVLALENFYNATKMERYKKLSIIAFNWFLGENHLHQVVYNASTGGCYDGLEAENVNLNQGAESTLSYLLARLAIERILHKEPSAPTLLSVRQMTHAGQTFEG